MPRRTIDDEIREAWNRRVGMPVKAKPKGFVITFCGRPISECSEAGKRLALRTLLDDLELESRWKAAHARVMIEFRRVSEKCGVQPAMDA